MHSGFTFSKTADSYHYDHSSEKAIWAISLVGYWVTHAFKVANCNGFSFNAMPLGLSPSGTLRLFMILYDSHTNLYVSHYEDICLIQDIDAQLLYMLFTLMDRVQPTLTFSHDCCSTGRNRIP